MIISVLLTVFGLAAFESINSIDNAVINAEVLETVSARAKRWFLTWGIFFAVFVVRGLLPLLIVWTALPQLGIVGAFFATFSSDPQVVHAIATATPILLLGAGTFLVFLFLHWLFVEDKRIGLHVEKFFMENSLWFHAVAAILLMAITWEAIKINPMLAFGATVGATGFFLTHGLKENAEKAEAGLKTAHKSDFSKLIYLEIIDMAFSIDGVLGAFAFTFSIPLILIGNGLGALVVRKMTVMNASAIKKYAFLKHGAMYSVLVLGIIMSLEGFGFHFPQYAAPLATFIIIGYFFMKSHRDLKQIHI